MVQLNIQQNAVNVVLASLDKECGVILRKTDTLRKMKDSLDDDMYRIINGAYQQELQLVVSTIRAIESQI